MKIIRKSIGTIMLLGAAAAGCAGDAEPMTPPSAGQSPVARTDTAAPPKIGDAGTDAPVMKAPSDSKMPIEAPKVEGPGKTDATASPKGAGAAAKLTAEDLDGIKELPKTEQDAAIAQIVCPVSQHNLGSMGKPLKVTAEGRTFYLCCESCESDLKKDAKGVIAKLDKLKDAK